MLLSIMVFLLDLNSRYRKMDKDRIAHIINGQYRKLQNHLKKIDKELNSEDIHQFRVEFKKLRAFLRMLSVKREIADEINLSKKLKTCYRITGLIRDFQLQQERIANIVTLQSEKTKAYNKQLQEEIENLKPGLSEHFSENPVFESKQKTKAGLPDEFHLRDFKIFIQKKWNVINGIIASGHFSDENIHTIRKNLKDLMYSVKIYSDLGINIPAVYALKGNDNEYFNLLLEELGYFQDKCTAIALMKIHWLDRLNKYDRELLESIKKIWMKEKTSAKQKLIRKLVGGSWK